MPAERGKAGPRAKEWRQPPNSPWNLLADTLVLDFCPAGL